MKNIILSVVASLVLTTSLFGQSPSKTVSADEIVKQIEAGRKISYENVTVTGDFDLSKLSKRKNDATYPEKGKTARVYSATISQPITFKNVVFTGKLDFFRKETNDREIKEYRLVFADAVKFETCVFNETADFELANFNNGVSFEESVFKAKPSFVRVGLEKIPNFTKTVFENGSVFQNTQNDKPRDLTAGELAGFYADYLKSR